MFIISIILILSRKYFILNQNQIPGTKHKNLFCLTTIFSYQTFEKEKFRCTPVNGQKDYVRNTEAYHSFYKKAQNSPSCSPAQYSCQNSRKNCHKQTKEIVSEILTAALLQAISVEPCRFNPERKCHRTDQCTGNNAQNPPSLCQYHRDDQIGQGLQNRFVALVPEQSHGTPRICYRNAHTSHIKVHHDQKYYRSG